MLSSDFMHLALVVVGNMWGMSMNAENAFAKS